MLGFTLTTDEYPYETEWQILRTGDGVEVLQGGPYDDGGTTHEYQACVSDACHMLILFDSWGDGLGSGAAYVVKMNGVPIVTTESFVGTWKNILFNCGP